jgi:hypothetical protein
MKIEKWTLGLAAIGLVTLAPALHAQTPPPQLVPAMTAVTATTISGYVDTSAVWNPGTGNANPAPYLFNRGKQDGFNLDAADVKISKPLDESQWSAGYTVELNYGPDAQAIDGRSNDSSYSSGATYPVRQAFVDLRMPVGNGLDWRIGRWDSLLGYESSDSMNNVNWTHTYGKTMEPTENTGLLVSYRFCDEIKLQFGVADTAATVGVNDRTDGGSPSYPIESKKAILSLLTLTAPDSWGFLKGSTLSGGFDLGQGYTTTGTYQGVYTVVDGESTDNGPMQVKAHDRSEWYVGATIKTPLDGLTVGAAYDGIEHNDIAGMDTGFFQSYAAYISYKATDKLTISARGEYASGVGLGVLDGNKYYVDTPVEGSDTNLYNEQEWYALTKVFDITGTVQYDLWANVITRVEVRWDHASSGQDAFGGSALTSDYSPTRKNEVMVAANVIYKF